MDNKVKFIKCSQSEYETAKVNNTLNENYFYYVYADKNTEEQSNSNDRYNQDE